LGIKLINNYKIMKQKDLDEKVVVPIEELGSPGIGGNGTSKEDEEEPS
jgi:hypothetical protein